MDHFRSHSPSRNVGKKLRRSSYCNDFSSSRNDRSGRNRARFHRLYFCLFSSLYSYALGIGKMKKITIVIDGPAGAGKSTVSQRLAQKLQYLYLNTGALYRAIALAAHQKNLPPQNSQKLYDFCCKARIEFKTIKGKQRVYLNGKNVTAHLYTAEMSLLASHYSKLPVVRKIGRASCRER